MGDVSLQTIVDDHLERLLTLRDSVVRCHAALCGSSEMDWTQYLSGLPPQPRAEKVNSHATILRVSESWLIANGIRDLVLLETMYFEQIRQILELALVAKTGWSEEQKMAEAQKRMEAKPATYAEILQQLDRLLEKGFPRRPEFEALETLFTVFASQAARHPYPGGDFPIVVTLCAPEIQGPPDARGILPYGTQRVTKTFEHAEKATVDKELIYLVFFTAFTICRELAEECSRSLEACNRGGKPRDIAGNN
jgi:hypothetical protein